MTRFSKLKKKIESDKVPNDISYEEICKYLKYYGFYLDRVNGSHHIFENIDGRQITIPVHSGLIKSPYIKKVISITGGKYGTREKIKL